MPPFGRAESFPKRRSPAASTRRAARGNGLSDWNVEDFSLPASVRDLETATTEAGVQRFPVLGLSQGCAVSIDYAVQHPERVSHLVLYGGYARGLRRRGPEDPTPRSLPAAIVTKSDRYAVDGRSGERCDANWQIRLTP